MNNCLACNNPRLKLCLGLGYQPLANNYDSNEKYPLEIVYCDRCWHAQLSQFVEPEKLYRNYYYASGTSKTLSDWFRAFVARCSGEKVLDIASNDGTLLRAFKEVGWEVLGIDPAANLTPKDIPTVVDFFGEDSHLGEFDAITAFNVLAHGPDPLGVLKGIYNNLKDNGTAYVMTSQGSMFANGQFDTIYHEHYSYFSPKSFQTLANRAGFTDISYTVEPIHGGSLLFTLTKSDNQTKLECERPDFEGFEDKFEQTRPYHTVGFGAAAKGVVMINALDQELAYVVDEAPLKIGKNIPGTTIPIVDTEDMAEDPYNLVIIIYAWNFYDEIVAKIKKLRPKRKDVFIRYYK